LGAKPEAAPLFLLTNAQRWTFLIVARRNERCWLSGGFASASVSVEILIRFENNRAN
jgi:hypothetical protein